MPGGETTLEVDVRDSLRDVLARLPSGGLVRLQIPPNSPLFVTAAEFGALKDASRLAGVDVVVHSADPLRLQLGRMLGLATVAAPPGPRPALPPRPAPRDRPAAAPLVPPAPTDPPRPRTEATDGRSDGGPKIEPTEDADPPAPVLGREPNDQPTMTRLVRQTLDRYAAPDVPPAAPVPQREDEPSAENLPRAGFDDDPEEIQLGPGRTWASILAERRADGREPDASPMRRPRRAVSRRVAAVLLTVLLVALLAGGAVALLPQAEVAITLARVPVNAELVYVVAPPGATVEGADLVVEGAPVTVPVTVAASVPTTGVRREPDAAASGAIRLSNPNPEPVQIEQGTTIAGVDGVEFAFVEDVEVPAGAAAENRFGAAQAEVRAVEPGGAGNLETGALGGRLPSGVYFSNRDGSMAGGTDRDIPVVAAADLAALRDQLAAALPDQAEEAVAGELPDGAVVAPSSLTYDEIEPTFDHQEGDDATEVRGEAVVPVTALTYNPDAIANQTRSALRERLGQRIQPGFELDEESIRVEEPQPIDPAGAAGAVRYRVAAEAVARAVLSDDQRQDLRSDLAGMGAADADAAVRALPGVEAVDLSFRPSWLPERMPRSARAIDVETRP